MVRAKSKPRRNPKYIHRLRLITSRRGVRYAHLKYKKPMPKTKILRGKTYRYQWREVKSYTRRIYMKTKK